MPNHIHFIIDIEAKRMGQSPIPAENSITTVSAVVGTFKSITPKIIFLLVLFTYHGLTGR